MTACETRSGVCVGDAARRGVGCAFRDGSGVCWPLHDIVITNILWCVAYKGRVGGRMYMAHKSRNCIAVVWVTRMGGVNEGKVDSCTHKKK